MKQRRIQTCCQIVFLLAVASSVHGQECRLDLNGPGVQALDTPIVGIQALDALDEEWAESPSEDHAYTVYYRERYKDDLPLIHKWVDDSFEMAEEEYGIVLPELHLYFPAIGETVSLLSTHRGMLDIFTAHLGGGLYTFDGSNGISPAHAFMPAFSSVKEYCAERENCLTAIRQRQDSDAAMIKLLVHEVFHHIQYEMRAEVLGTRHWSRVLPSWRAYPRWFTEGGAELAGWKVNPKKDQMFKLLLNQVDQNRHTVVCCWGLGSEWGLDFSDAYRTPWLFLSFAEEYCGQGFYKNILITEEETFQHAWELELEACDETVPSLFAEFQDWFDEHRPLEGGIARIPDARDQEEAERLRRLVELLKELLFGP